MYQPDINTYLEAIKQQFDSLLQDNKLLKQENSKLLELNNQYFQKMQYYMELCKKQTTTKEDVITSKPIIKMGSDWSVEGEHLFNISLFYKINLYSTIKKISVSNDGSCICFVSGNEVFLLINKVLYVVENNNRLVLYKYIEESLKDGGKRVECVKRIEMSRGDYIGNRDMGIREHSNNKRIDPASVDLKKFSISFTPNSNFLYVSEISGFIRKWDLTSKTLLYTWNIPEPIDIKSTNNLLYCICKDRTFRIYDRDKLVLVINTNEELCGPLIVSKESDCAYSLGINGCSTNLIIFDLLKRTFNSIQTNEDNICDLSILKELGFLCLSTNYSLNFYKTHPNIRFLSSNENRESNYCLSSYKNILFVGQKGGISLYDIKNKKKMKINIHDGYICSIDTNSNIIAIVEKGNIVKLFEYSY